MGSEAASAGRPATPAGRAVALLGLPYDGGSSFRRGAAAGPAATRRALHSPAGNLCSEGGVDLGGGSRFVDHGDVDLAGCAEPLREIERAAGALLAAGSRVLALGGDHSVSLPLLRAHAARLGPPVVLQIDAHPDLYDEFLGDRLSHACPFARVMEEGLARRLVQAGIRSRTPHLRAQAERFGVEVWEAGAGLGEELRALAGPLYLSLDLDALDPAHAPGVAHPEPGGLTSRQVLDFVRRLEGPLVGADIVELNPDLDPGDVTARLAAKLLKEVAAKMLEGLDAPPERASR